MRLLAVGARGSLSPAASHLLIRNRWAGNVRELENAIERAMLVCETGEIAPSDLPDAIREEGTPDQEFTRPPHRTLAEIEKMAILQALHRTTLEQAGSRANPRLVAVDALQQDEAA